MITLHTEWFASLLLVIVVVVLCVGSDLALAVLPSPFVSYACNTVRGDHSIPNPSLNMTRTFSKASSSPLSDVPKNIPTERPTVLRHENASAFLPSGLTLCSYHQGRFIC